MKEFGIRRDLLLFNLLIILVVAVVAVICIYCTEMNLILMFTLFSSLGFTMIFSYSLGLQKGLLVALLGVFLYGSYVIYQVMVTKQIMTADFSHIVWLILFPLSALLVGKFSETISRYVWEIGNLQSIQKLVTIDGSTGFYNNQGFFKKLDEEFLRSKRYKNPFSLLLLQIANFNEIRMLYGEADSGKILKEIADVMNKKVRYSDVKGLLDDNVLGSVLTETNADGAKIVIEKLHAALNMVTVEIRGIRKVIKVKPSIGIATMQEDDKDVLEMFERAKSELHYDRG